MTTPNSQENQDNEFINNFDKNFITIPKNALHIKKLTHKNLHFYLPDPESIQNDHSLNSVTEILEESRGKVLNSLSMKSLNSPSRQGHIVQKSTSLSRLKAKESKVQTILNNRFSEYKQKISKSINKLESICEQNFGGLKNINSELSKHQLTRDQLVEYYAKMLSPHSNLPTILQKYKQGLQKHKQANESEEKLPKIRSVSLKKISFVSGGGEKRKKEGKHNKWYIEPEKRFSVSNDKTVYDWRSEEGVRNVIRSEELKIKSKEIGKLIKEVKQKFNREPVFCKYVRVG